jgi:indole-3-glycerol phosphate synthase
VSAQAGTVLDRILAETRASVRQRKRDRRQPPAARRPEPARSHALSSALRTPEIGVIAEFKRRSPSAGELCRDATLPDVVGAYVDGGAVALSILTEEPNFGGSLEDLVIAREACALPLLRKDFIVDPYQLHEAAAAGADAVLLIVAALSGAELASLREQACALGLEALVEVHDEHEVEIAVAAGAEIVGVNNRDLRDFSVDVGRTERLLAALPADVLVVSESGISEPGQLHRLQSLGVSAVLVGETLMRAPDPAAALSSLRASEPPTRF